MPVRASNAPRVALAAAVGLLATSAGVDAAIADPSSCSAPAVSDPTSDSFKVGSPARRRSQVNPPSRAARQGAGGRGAARGPGEGCSGSEVGVRLAERLARGGLHSER